MIKDKYQNEVLIAALQTAIPEWEKFYLITAEPNLKIYLHEARCILANAEIKRAEYNRTEQEEERGRLMRVGINPERPF